MPAPSPTLITYDRGSQAVIISGVSGNIALGANSAQPAGTTAYGIAPSLSRAMQPPNMMMQVDVGGTGALTSAQVNVLGSLDGVSWGVIGAFTITSGNLAAGSTQLQPFSGNAQVRYICASVSSFVVASGAPTLKISFAM